MDKFKFSKVPAQKVLYTLLTNFLLLIASLIFVNMEFVPNRLFPLVAILGLTFLVLGGFLIYIAIKRDKGRCKNWLLITGIFAVAPLVFTILHNTFYALKIQLPNLSSILDFLSGVSFIISIIVAPTTFLAGSIISLYLLQKTSLKNKKI
jgi:hypothetical protein